MVENRTGKRHEESKEMLVDLELNLDGTGIYKFEFEGKFTETPHVIPMFEHFLQQIVKWGHHDLRGRAVSYDGLSHHFYEGVSTALAHAYRDAVGDRSGIVRIASGKMPMEGCLVDMALDLSGRPYLNLRTDIKMQEYRQMFEHVFRTLVTKSDLADLYIVTSGEDDHHQVETAGKLFGDLMYRATRRDTGYSGVLSTAA